jgi:hypothetical protein
MDGFLVNSALRGRRHNLLGGVAMAIAMGYELVPAYLSADLAGHATLAATADTLAAIALVINAADNFLDFGVGVPL